MHQLFTSTQKNTALQAVDNSKQMFVDKKYKRPLYIICLLISGSQSKPASSVVNIKQTANQSADTQKRITGLRGNTP